MKTVLQDIIDRQDEIGCRAWLQEHAPNGVLKNLELAANDPWVQGADGIYYRDTRTPALLAADGTATILTTSVLIHSAMFTTLPAGYWYPGKKVKLTVYGAWTAGATPGNLTTEIRYGTTSNGGTVLATSATVAANAAKTSISVMIEATVTCRSIGASGSFLTWGRFVPDQVAVVIPAANTPQMLPAASPAGVAIDTTSTVAGFHGINIQMKRSGSTAETFITHDVTFEALN